MTISRATSAERQKIASGELPVTKKTVFVQMKAYDISQTTCPVEDYPGIQQRSGRSGPRPCIGRMLRVAQ